MGVADEIEGRVRPAVEAAGLELVDVQFRTEASGWVLRFFLDKEGGFGLADCEEWSERLGGLVDESGLIPQAYSLEVSSPGLARALKKREDFERFKGIEVIVKTFAPLNNQRNFHGRIEAVEGEDLVMWDRSTGRVRIPFTAMCSARLDPPISMQ